MTSSAPTSVFLIRHADYDHRPSAAGEAASDHGLSELGRRQAQALADRLARTREIAADALYCSTLPRARQTAERIAPVLGCTPVALPGLCEWDSGNEAIGIDRFVALFRSLRPEQRRRHRFHPGAETIAEFAERVARTLDGLLAQSERRTIVIVAHGGVVEAAFCHFLGYGPGPYEGGHPAVGQASITLWQRQAADEDWTLEFSNDTHHLACAHGGGPPGAAG